MMMHIKHGLRFALLIMTLLGTGRDAVSQNVKGFVDFERVIQALPAYETEKVKLDLMITQIEDSLTLLVNEYQQFLQHEVPNGTKLDADELAKIEGQITEMETRIIEYNERSKTMLLEEDKAMQTRLENMIESDLERFSIEKGVDCIIHRAPQQLETLYGDYTEEFIQYINGR